LPGARLAVAGNGFEALLAIGQQTPDVLITDIVMPHMDGLEMLRHLAGGGPARSRLIVATSSHRPEQLARLGALPADVHFVPKPIEPQPLIALLRGEAAALRATPSAPG
jgi:CheY-like chemotaxis protein